MDDLPGPDRDRETVLAAVSPLVLDPAGDPAPAGPKNHPALGAPPGFSGVRL